MLGSNVFGHGGLGVHVVHLGVLSFAQFLGIRYRRQNEPVQTSYAGRGIGNVLALLHFEVVAVLVDGLSRLESLSARGVVKRGPEIGVGEDGVSASEGGDERVFVVEVRFDYFDAFGGPGLGFGWVSGYAADFPAGLFRVELGDGTAL